MMTYFDLEEFYNGWNGEIGIFGAGYIGRNIAYDMLKSIGCRIHFYFDNNILPGTVIKDNIKVKELEYLYKNKENIKIFLAVGVKHRNIIMSQLNNQGNKNVFNIDSKV